MSENFMERKGEREIETVNEIENFWISTDKSRVAISLGIIFLSI